ncbi:uncharacterized protein ABDE67_017354 [Symphorus nematophorus]
MDNLLTCEVTNGDDVKEFPFRLRPPGEKPDWRWLYVTVAAVVVVALLIIIVKVIRRRRSEGKETQTNDNVADPEGGVSYASISYTKKTNGKARALGKHEDKDNDETVTYATVNASSSSAEPSDLYATVKPNQ